MVYGSCVHVHTCLSNGETGVERTAEVDGFSDGTSNGLTSGQPPAPMYVMCFFILFFLFSLSLSLSPPSSCSSRARARVWLRYYNDDDDIGRSGVYFLSTIETQRYRTDIMYLYTTWIIHRRVRVRETVLATKLDASCTSTCCPRARCTLRDVKSTENLFFFQSQIECSRYICTRAAFQCGSFGPSENVMENI